MANRLANCTSPYLQQHKDQPIHWQPWDAEALAQSKSENKPIFLSIGYASCHWCHAMAHEAFVRADIAELLNERFVSIKVDREQRPDLDAIYQHALLAINGQSGWPLTLLLTPDGYPFFGGTYFPPGELLNLLRSLSKAWRKRPKDIQIQVRRVRHALDSLNPVPGTLPESVDLGAATAAWMGGFDHLRGGFGRAPKFPQPPVLAFLLSAGERTGNADAVQAVYQTLSAMANGGIHDHIGGGFHRYSTDSSWKIPHFEKIMSDNAQLLALYARTAVAKPDASFAAVADGIVGWLLRDMRREDGLFASAQDADSDSGDETQHEERFYSWGIAELKELLADDFAWFASAFEMPTEFGPDDRIVLNRNAAGHIDDSERMTNVLDRLRCVRAQSVAPAVDSKALTDANALLIESLALAGQHLNRPEWIALAESTAEMLLSLMVDESGAVRHSYCNGRIEADCFAEDAANLANALIALHRATGKQGYLSQAEIIATRLFADFSLTSGAVASTPHHAPDLIHRPTLIHDNTAPSANGAAARLCLSLAPISSARNWLEHAESIFSAYADFLTRTPAGIPVLALAFADSQSARTGN